MSTRIASEPPGSSSFSTPVPHLSAEEIAQAASKLETAEPQEILAWAFATFGEQVTLACSFSGPSGMVLLDMAARLRPNVPVFYLDTGFLFAETRALARRAAKRYHITPQALRPAITPKQQIGEYGARLWKRDPDQCCHIRKVTPQRDYLQHYAAWITGIRRDQSSTRREVPVVQWDAVFDLVKISPLARWTEREVWSYVMAHDVPYNPLHDQGYPSIGCTHCTRPVMPGEDGRAGRWSGTTKIECGLHQPLKVERISDERASE